MCDEVRLHAPSLLEQRLNLEGHLAQLGHWCKSAGHELLPIPVSRRLIQAGVDPNLGSCSGVGLLEASGSHTDGLLQAQLREVQTWLADARNRAAGCTGRGDGIATLLEAERQSKPANAVLRELFRERCDAAARVAAGTRDSEAFGARAAASAASAMRALRLASTQRTLALEQVRGVTLQIQDDLCSLQVQLDALERNPGRSPELTRCVVADVALAFVGAIEQRCAVASSCSDAVRSAATAREAVDAHDQLLSCCCAAIAAEFPLASGGEPAAHRETPPQAPAAAVAGHFTEPETQHARGRAMRLATENEDLWTELWLKWQQGQGVSPIAAYAFSAATPSLKGAVSVSTELQTLRAAEGRLHTTLPSVPFVGTACMLDLEEGSALTRGPDREDIFDAWRVVALDLRQWRDGRRRASRRRILSNSRYSARVVWWLVAQLSLFYDQPMPEQLRRGEKVFHMPSQRLGQVLSMSPKRVCKVSLRGLDIALFPASELRWLEERPHYYQAYVAFSLWAVLLEVGLQRRVAAFRLRIISHKSSRNGPRLLSWLVAAADDDAVLGRFCLEAWRRAVRTGREDSHNLLSWALAAWHQGMLYSRHVRTCEDLVLAGDELANARRTLFRQKMQSQRLCVRLGVLDEVSETLMKSWIMTAWFYSTKLALSEMGLRKRTRIAAQAIASDVSDGMGRQAKRMLLTISLAAWDRVRKGRRLKQRVIRTMDSVWEASTAKPLLIHCWQTWRSVTLNARGSVRRREAVEKRLHEVQGVSQDLYSFARDADQRVRRLEDALQAADEALHAQVRHGHDLESKLASLRRRNRAPVAQSHELRTSAGQ